MNKARRTHLLAAAAGLSLIGTATGCSPEPADPSGQDAAGNSTMGSESGTGAGSERGTGEYADGTYTAVGSYQSPNGTETIDVELTLRNNQVADVAVTSHPTNPYTKRFQGEFVDGIHEVVVGKPIDELDVSRVGGSSLTSGGFRDAVEQIKSEAQR